MKVFALPANDNRVPAAAEPFEPMRCAPSARRYQDLASFVVRELLVSDRK